MTSILPDNIPSIPHTAPEGRYILQRFSLASPSSFFLILSSNKLPTLIRTKSLPASRISSAYSFTACCDAASNTTSTSSKKSFTDLISAFLRALHNFLDAFGLISKR